MSNFRELVQPLINHLILVGPDQRGVKAIAHNFIRSQPNGYNIDSAANLHTLELKTDSPITEAVPRMTYVCADLPGVSFRSTLAVYHDSETTGLIIFTKDYAGSNGQARCTVRIYASTKDEHNEIMAFVRRMNAGVVGA